MPADALGRFTNRTRYYARSRPRYPDEVLTLLAREAGWNPQSTVADIGAGTGISSELFLRPGNVVWAVEPNAEMRSAMESLRFCHPQLHIVDGWAERTGLLDSCADLVVAATAFHWFDPDQCRIEFRRILKPGGYVVLLWNQRRSDKSAFSQSYEELVIRFGTDYKNRWGKERHNLSESADRFFQPGSYGLQKLPNSQQLDFDGLRDRLLSSSYAPLPGDENYEPMLAALRDLFRRFAYEGRVVFEYDISIYWGQVPAT